MLHAGTGRVVSHARMTRPALTSQCTHIVSQLVWRPELVGRHQQAAQEEGLRAHGASAPGLEGTGGEESLEGGGRGRERGGQEGERVAVEEGVADGSVVAPQAEQMSLHLPGGRRMAAGRF